MSVQQLGAVFERSRSRNGARLVLLSIANHDGDGGSWPTISTISRESGLGERAVHEALRRLQADGELKVHPNAGGTMDWRNDRRPNRYEIVLPDGVEDSATPSPNGVGDSSERGGRLRRDGVGDSATQTIQEPSTEPSTRERVGAAFEQFWQIYPKKSAKVAALKAYERAVKRADSDIGQAVWKINSAAKVYAQVCDPKYHKMPQGWLNDGRWEDEALQPRRARAVEEDQAKLIAEYNSIRYT